jgi:hypothetical protein
VTINDEVLFEVDEYTATDAWSVVVRARRTGSTPRTRSRRRICSRLEPWIPTVKYNYVRIVAASLSGREFVRGEEPDRYGIQEY